MFATNPCDKSSFPADPSEALEKLMVSYGSMVLRIAFFYLGDRHLAEDIGHSKTCSGSPPTLSGGPVPLLLFGLNNFTDCRGNRF